MLQCGYDTHHLVRQAAIVNRSQANLKAISLRVQQGAFGYLLGWVWNFSGNNAYSIINQYTGKFTINGFYFTANNFLPRFYSGNI